MELVCTGNPFELFEMSKNCINIIVIDCLWTSLALAVFFPAIEGIFKLNINSRNCRTATNDSLYFRDKRLKTRSKGCIYTCTKNSWINQSLGQRFRLSISTEESSQVVYQEGVYIEILQLQLIKVFQMSGYNNLTEEFFSTINYLLFLFLCHHILIYL